MCTIIENSHIDVQLKNKILTPGGFSEKLICSMSQNRKLAFKCFYIFKYF